MGGGWRGREEEERGPPRPPSPLAPETLPSIAPRRCSHHALRPTGLWALVVVDGGCCRAEPRSMFREMCACLFFLATPRFSGYDFLPFNGLASNSSVLCPPTSSPPLAFVVVSIGLSFALIDKLTDVATARRNEGCWLG